MNRLSRFLLWVVAGLALAVVCSRFVFGAGAPPQGIWSSFDVTSVIILAAGLAAAGALAWRRSAGKEEDPATLPELDCVGATWLGSPRIAGRKVYSLAFVAAIAFGFAFLAPQQAASKDEESAPAHRARGGTDLWIDGNQDGRGVSFPHQMHVDIIGGEASCGRCHHMDMPADQASVCSECHRSLYGSTDVFQHDWHTSPSGANLACAQCHEEGRVRSSATARTCVSCHKDMIPEDAEIRVASYYAPGYVDAIGGLCAGCHSEPFPTEMRGPADPAEAARRVPGQAAANQPVGN